MPGTIYMAAGVLRATARGFWYTKGGEKGPFGFYPHLKDGNLPVYADTQVHGNLKTAAFWLVSLEQKAAKKAVEKIAAGQNDSVADSEQNPPSRVPFSDADVFGVFGKEGEERQAFLATGDLRLSEASVAEWEKLKRFSVKPRIEIDPATRTVEGGMLAFLELAWLHDLTLEAPLYLGYFETKAELDRAKILVAEAADLLAGFGAFRTRGFGGGPAEMIWESDCAVAGDGHVDAPEARMRYTLTAVTNVRNRPIEPGKSQVLETDLPIFRDQVRGWFVRAYHGLYGQWPSVEEMATVEFSTLFPTPDGAPTLPPPATTLVNEKGEVKDAWGLVPEREAPGESETAYDNFFNTKAKPLGAGHVVTAGGKVHPVRIENRFRNQLDTDFVAADGGGLIVQQLMPAGTIFTGTVDFMEPGGLFAMRAHRVLRGVMPTIKRAVFEPVVSTEESTDNTEQGPWVVTEPIPLLPGMLETTSRVEEALRGKNQRLVLATLRRYNATLKRPRRNRVVVAPGSVLTVWQAGARSWDGFGNPLQFPQPDTPPPPAKVVNDNPFKELAQTLVNGGFSKSQAGILRVLRDWDYENAKRAIEKQREKYTKEGETSAHKVVLMNTLLEELGDDGISGKARLDEAVSRINEALRLLWYEREDLDRG